MDSDNLIQLLQKSFHVTLGATAALVEVLQDPQKREQNLTKLRLELDELAQEWSEKGEVTEVEARNFVSSILEPQGEQANFQSGSGTSSPSSTTATPAAGSTAQVELQELTAQLAALRTELERLRNESNS